MSEAGIRIRRRRTISARFFWVTSLIAAAMLAVTFLKLPMFPRKWGLYLAGGLILLLSLTFLLSAHTKPKNAFTKFINGSLTLCLFAGSVFLPYETDKISGLFSQIGGQQVTVSLYALKNSPYASLQLNSSEDLSALSDAVFITDKASDAENENYVLDQLSSAFGQNADSVDELSYSSAIQSLYDGGGDILILSEGFASTAAESDNYSDFNDRVQKIYSFKRTVHTNDNIISADVTKKPFTIFIGGNDEEGDLSLYGRTDVNMLLTVNPSSHQVAMISVPRDSYIPNPAFGDRSDKLTHLGLQGIDNTTKGLGNYLDTDIDYYVLVNFTTFSEIIQALGGITVNNPYEFSCYYNDVTFPAGEIQLDSVTALLYVRERYNLPDGDFGRNMHQQIVMKAIIDKITSKEGITHFNDLLDSLSGTFLTNLSSDSIYSLVRMQLSQNIDWNIVNYHVEGEMDEAECASAQGEYLSVVRPYENQVEYVRNVIDQVENGDVVQQETLPEGQSDDTQSYTESYSY